MLFRSPRVMQLVGSAAYDSQSSIVMGTAEGGLKVTLDKRVMLTKIN